MLFPPLRSVRTLAARCGRVAGVALAAMALAGVGCAKLTYDRLILGEPPSKYERMLPASESRRTAVGLCQLKKSAGGKTESILLVLSDDRRLAGKIRVQRAQRESGLLSRRTYELYGSINPGLYGAAEAGPADVLRSLVRSLVDYRGEKLAMEAHRLVAAGLLRLLERWPEAADLGLSAELTADLAEIAPSGGTSRIDVRESGVIDFQYN